MKKTRGSINVANLRTKRGQGGSKNPNYVGVIYGSPIGMDLFLLVFRAPSVIHRNIGWDLGSGGRNEPGRVENNRCLGGNAEMACFTIWVEYGTRQEHRGHRMLNNGLFPCSSPISHLHNSI